MPRIRDDRADAFSYLMEAEAFERSRREPVFPLEVRIYHNQHMDRLEVHSDIARAFNIRTIVDERGRYRDPDWIRRVAREHAYRYAEIIEQQMLEQLSRATDAQRRENYHRSVATDYMSHVRDLWRGDTGKDVELSDKPIEALASIEHRLIEMDGWKAALIQTTNEVLKEGETMSHCMGQAYMSRIYLGNYLAFHITAPEGAKFPKSGFTLGFNKDDKANTKWKFDQIKGKKNSTHYCSDPSLLAFLDHVTGKINSGRIVREEKISWVGKSKRKKTFHVKQRGVGE